MGTSIELRKSNGEVINAELVSYFELASTGKKYVFYTLNETIENGLVKMYVSEVSNTANTLASQMTDEEWTNLKLIMKSMLTGEDNPNIKYLRWED